IRRYRHGRALRLWSRADLCGDGRSPAGRHRDHSPGWGVLRLRRKIRWRWVKTRMPRESFTVYLPKSTDAGSEGTSGNWMSRRIAFRLPLRRPLFRKWRADLAGSEHATRHDADVPGARASRGSGIYIW